MRDYTEEEKLIAEKMLLENGAYVNRELPSTKKAHRKYPSNYTPPKRRNRKKR